MRTTLDIDDDVLMVAKELARQDKVSAGAALSRLARSALLNTPGAAGGKSKAGRAPAFAGQFAMLPKRDEVITNEHINRLRDELGI